MITKTYYRVKTRNGKYSMWLDNKNQAEIIAANCKGKVEAKVFIDFSASRK